MSSDDMKTNKHAGGGATGLPTTPQPFKANTILPTSGTASDTSADDTNDDGTPGDQ